MRGLSLSRPHPRRVRHARHPCPHTFWQSYAHRRPTTVTPHEPTRHAAARVLDIARRPRRHVPRAHPRKQPTPPTQHTQARHALPRQPPPLGYRQVRGQLAIHLPDRRGRKASHEVAGLAALPRDYPAKAPLIQIAAVLPSPQPHPQPRHRQLQPAQVHGLASLGGFAIISGVEVGACAHPRNIPVSFHPRSVTHLPAPRRRLSQSPAQCGFRRSGGRKQFQPLPKPLPWA